MTDYPRRGDRPPWSWQGATALTLAFFLGAGWLIGIVLGSLEAAGVTRLDDDLASLLNGIGQVLAGALGTYLGFSVGAGVVARQTANAPESPQEADTGPSPRAWPPKTARPPDAP